MTVEILKQCPICEATERSPYIQVKDHTVSKADFTIVKCDGCGFLYTNPRPPADAIGTYYESSEYISHHDDGKDLMSTLYSKVRDFTTQQKIKLLEKSIGNKGELLDVGSGAGFFLSKAQVAGWQVAGTEPDTQARTVGRSRVGDDIYETIEDPFFDNKRYHAITMWHVLEHVHRLNETMAWIHNHLGTEGKLFIAVPNPESADARKYKQNWAAYDVPRHLYHFSKKAMRQLAEKHNFKVEEIRPMWFDSYYVGMLSTRYEQGKTDMLKSIWEGTTSNWQSWRDSTKDPNTSSLIYVLSKV